MATGGNDSYDGGGGGEDLLAGINITVIRQLVNSLSPDQLAALYTQLGISEQDLTELLDPAKMHIKSYEQQLMQYPEYRVNKWILLYMPPILVILGTFGNIFSFIILKRKAMLKFSTYYYLMVLAVADTLVLFIGLLRLWVGELTGYDLRDQGDWLCKLTNVIGYTISDFSVWLIIAVTVERYIVVCYPLKAASFCSTPRARKVILALLFFLFMLNLHFFWTVQVVYFKHKGEYIPRCAGGPQHEELVEEIWPWVDAIIYSFLPFAMIMLLNGLIIRQVVLAHHSRCVLQPPNNVGYTQRRPSNEGSTRLTAMLLTISFAFLLTTLPMNIVNIATAFWNRKYLSDMALVSKFKLARTITEMLMYINHSMNFFLYCAAGQKFRHQLVWMVCYAKRTYNLSWNSDHSQNSKMESIRIHTLKRRSQGDMYATIRNEMYTPLKYPL